ncbi:MAG: hypothetical protein K6E85_10395 [Lachnospiraceae bacterium]|nr:hypothetical protein [Lachnospiraceae bacterium]
MTKAETRASVVKIYTENINDPEKQIKEYKKQLKKAQEADSLQNALRCPGRNPPTDRLSCWYIL